MATFLATCFCTEADHGLVITGKIEPYTTACRSTSASWKEGCEGLVWQGCSLEVLPTASAEAAAKESMDGDPDLEWKHAKV